MLLLLAVVAVAVVTFVLIVFTVSIVPVYRIVLAAMYCCSH